MICASTYSSKKLDWFSLLTGINGETMKILLVDDDEFVCGMLDSVLLREGYQTSIARNGDEAVKKIKNEKFDLMITDILMPQKEGIEVIQEVRGANPQLKIIAISSGGRAGYTSFLRIAETFGADASLEKPFTAAQLLSKIEEIKKQPLSA